MTVAVALWLSFGAAPVRAQQAEDLESVAQEAGVDATDLLGALFSQPGVEARQYLIFDGKLTPPVPVITDWRVACIEAKESQGFNVWNRQGSGAGGVMQYMPGTFRAHAAEMGHPEWSLWVPWQARAVAAHDLALGRRRQWTVSGC